MLEHLETRRLLAVTAVLEDGIVKITGTSDADRVGVHVQAGDATHFLVVSAEQAPILTVPLADVDGIEARLGGGDDALHTQPELPKPMKVYGEGGRDRLSTGAAADLLDGGEGDDLLVASRGADRFVGGIGRDTVTYADYLAGVRVTLDNQPNDGALLPTANTSPLPVVEGDNVTMDIEVVIGGKGNDNLQGVTSLLAVVLPAVQLVGGPGNDRLSAGLSHAGSHLIGGDGNDELIGGPHADLMDAGTGNDFMNGNTGPDDFRGGPGADTVTYANRTVNLRVTLDGMPNDGAVLSSTNTGSEGDNVRRDVERVIGGSGDDFIGLGPIVSTGPSLEANFGPIIFDGGPGNDTLVAQPPNTTLDVAVLLPVGGGTLVEAKSLDVTRIAEQTITGEAALASDPTSPGPINATRVFAILSGGEGNDRLAGSPFSDQLNGGPGNDTLFGHAGNDVLVGGAGVDSLFGGHGDDVLNSRDGEADKVDGGEGTDRAISDDLDELISIEVVAP